MRAIILARVSGVEQGKTTSLRAQIKRLREYCSKKELFIIKEHTIIESSTQGKRKQFYDILEGIKRGTEVIALVADAVDRVQRDFKETIILNELIFNRKIELHFIRENIIINYESTPGTHIVWDALVMSAKMFVLNLKESSKRGFAYSREKGIYPASARPPG